MSLTFNPEVHVKNIQPAVSDNFRKQAWNVVFSIIAFIAVFVLLVTAVIGLALLAGYLAVLILAIKLGWLTMILAGGFLITGVSLLVFAVKFLFTKGVDSTSEYVELTKEDHPKLFGVLNELTKETKVSFPHKVYLSPDANAAVFKRTRFINVIIPAKKNLLIGAALVNNINVSEFKAIMAHEFGHFNQSSLKIGSFIYNVNRVIYNMLYENTGYLNFIQRWAQMHAVLVLFANITLKISTFVQWVLRGMYVMINKNYMALSREMEYNADEVAAITAGTNNFISGLENADKASGSYQNALDNVNGLPRGKRVRNIYEVQQLESNNLSASGYQSRIRYTDQWASHPTNKERADNLAKLNIFRDTDNTSAWELFDNATAVQEELTNRLYASVEFETEPERIGKQQYEEWFRESVSKFAFPAEYNGFYDRRFISLTREQIEECKRKNSGKTFEEIFTEENGKIQQRITGNQSDFHIARAIADKNIKVKTFDFDGQKYDASNASDVAEDINREIERLRTRQQALDREAFTFFYKNAVDNAALESAYERLFASQKLVDQYTPFIQEAWSAMQESQVPSSFEKAEHIAVEFRRIDKVLLKTFLKDPGNTEFIHAETKEKLLAFQDKSYAYFADTSYMDNEVEEFSTLVYLVNDEMNMRLHSAHKNLAEVQLKSLHSN